MGSEMCIRDSHMGEGDFFWQRLEPCAMVPVKPKRAPGDEDDAKLEQATSALLSITGPPKKPKLVFGEHAEQQAEAEAAAAAAAAAEEEAATAAAREAAAAGPPREERVGWGDRKGGSEPPGPAARYGHAAVSLDDNTMWIFGGRGPGGAIFGDTWVLELPQGGQTFGDTSGGALWSSGYSPTRTLAPLRLSLIHI